MRELSRAAICIYFNYAPIIGSYASASNAGGSIRMGWLRDSMHQMRGPHRSFGAVARAAVAHPSWPKDAKSQPRSLASLLSKLDRGMELQWLADRPPVQRVLAEVLGVSPSRV